MLAYIETLHSYIQSYVDTTHTWTYSTKAKQTGRQTHTHRRAYAYAFLLPSVLEHSWCPHELLAQAASMGWPDAGDLKSLFATSQYNAEKLLQDPTFGPNRVKNVLALQKYPIVLNESYAGMGTAGITLKDQWQHLTKTAAELGEPADRGCATGRTREQYDHVIALVRVCLEFQLWAWNSFVYHLLRILRPFLTNGLMFALFDSLQKACVDDMYEPGLQLVSFLAWFKQAFQGQLLRLWPAVISTLCAAKFWHHWMRTHSLHMCRQPPPLASGFLVIRGWGVYIQDDDDLVGRCGSMLIWVLYFPASLWASILSAVCWARMCGRSVYRQISWTVFRRMPGQCCSGNTCRHFMFPFILGSVRCTWHARTTVWRQPQQPNLGLGTYFLESWLNVQNT